MAVIPMEEHAAIDKLLVWYLVGFPLKHLTVVKHPGLALPPTLDAKTNLNETVSWHLEDHLSKRQNSGTYLTCSFTVQPVGVLQHEVKQTPLLWKKTWLSQSFVIYILMQKCIAACKQHVWDVHFHTRVENTGSTAMDFVCNTLTLDTGFETLECRGSPISLSVRVTLTAVPIQFISTRPLFIQFVFVD